MTDGATAQGGQDRARLHAFVDEYGDHNLRVETDGASTHYIVTAVLIGGHEVEAVRAAVERVRATRFGTAEMKSSRVGGDDNRRLRVLGDLAELPFKFVSLVVDKRQVWANGGLIYKQPFIKFVQRQLFEKLYRAHPDLVLLADEHGGKSFMDGFRHYVARHVEQDLFRRPDFDFGVSRTEPLLQLADFIAGTVARLYDPKRESLAGPQFAEVLRDRAMLILAWPPEDRPLATLGGRGTRADRRIREYALGRVFALLAKGEPGPDPADLAQVAVMEHLLFHFQSISEREYVATGHLREVLKEQGIAGFDEQQQFRSGVIAKLRDRGVLLASSSKGYKIPSSLTDVMDFVQQTDKMIYPMLGRLERARESIKLLTGGSVDILGDERFEYARALLDRGPLSRAEPSRHDGSGDGEA